MSAGEVKLPPAVGFLTIVEHAQHGLFGGYLVLNTAGRPLEFHCTTPVKANRAQQILYGPTLASYLYGELIGHTLVAKAAVKPLVVCTDLPDALALRQQVEMPVALVLNACGQQPAAPPEAEGLLRADSKCDRVAAPHWLRFQLGANELAVEAHCAADRELIVTRIGAVAERLDLGEPFSRIRDAIEEAQRGR